MLSDFVEPKWQRRRGVRRVHVVAVLIALAAAAGVLLLFSAYGIVDIGPARGERQLIATVDLRLGTPGLAADRGAALARQDLEAGLLKLQTLGPPPGKGAVARAERMTQRYGVGFAHYSEQRTPETEAFVAAYNRVMAAEIERRHGKDVAEGLLGFDDMAPRAASGGTR